MMRKEDMPMRWRTRTRVTVRDIRFSKPLT